MFITLIHLHPKCNRHEADSKSRRNEFHPGPILNTFVEIDYKIFATVILLLLPIQEGLVTSTGESMRLSA